MYSTKLQAVLLSCVHVSSSGESLATPAPRTRKSAVGLYKTLENLLRQIKRIYIDFDLEPYLECN